MTNAERIRSMDEDELVDLLLWHWIAGSHVPRCDEGCAYEEYGCMKKCPKERRERNLREWLNKEEE